MPKFGPGELMPRIEVFQARNGGKWLPKHGSVRFESWAWGIER
ncbi:MAG: hypothetical protein VXZ49_03435 [Planctomycetota bacterium]|nr:hypothetical protein [Planctomycetota bacterium]